VKSLRNQLSFLALLVAVAAVAVGCGGGGSSSSAAGGGEGSSGGAATTQFTSASTGSSGSESSGSSAGDSSAGAGAPQAQVKEKDPVSEGAAAVSIEPRNAPLGVDNDEIQTTGAKVIQPCQLVRRGEAAAILGSGTTAAERPQGPTCVYSNAGRTVTLAIEDNSVKQLTAGARKATKVKVGGKTGWCIRYQSTAVIVGISEGRVLRADGPCQAGVRFVSKALRHL
jgi:hypothetical protein